MAHHRQEFALGPVGGLGRIPRLDQVEGSQVDDLLEMVTVFFQIAIPLVDLLQHVVETFGQLTRFVLMVTQVGTQGVVFFLGYGVSHLGQADQGARQYIAG